MKSSHEDISYECAVCSAVFKHKHSLARHKRCGCRSSTVVFSLLDYSFCRSHDAKGEDVNTEHPNTTTPNHLTPNENELEHRGVEREFAATGANILPFLDMETFQFFGVEKPVEYQSEEPSLGMPILQPAPNIPSPPLAAPFPNPPSPVPLTSPSKILSPTRLSSSKGVEATTPQNTSSNEKSSLSKSQSILERFLGAPPPRIYVEEKR